ncbi:sulfite exporter TauE/SafE family protein [Verticiella sediminum]|uniref:Probable membrane transporter protein n=1 Tax=Verticiella sediminum TaxID=1247510 RepID=A0A556ABL7_9BURK|nr:sulfite exporter TauE/SafE family protein [Verticiella sediminum]TSH90278.1 sulfite exporter TauE/SafE family protein [Verticiella sediminum]
MTPDVLFDLAIWLVLGGVLGVLGGLFGIGGGLMAIPLLGLLGGMPQQLAQGTALVMVLPTVLLAAHRYHQRARIDVLTVAVISVCAIGFTWVGAQAALGMDADVLRRSFAGFLGLIALQYVWQARRKPLASPRADRIGTGPAALLGVTAGLIGGFFGVGGGVLAAPVLSGVFRLGQTVAQGMALAMVVPTAAIGLATYGAAGQVAWPVGAALAVGGLLCVGPGVRLAHRLPEVQLKLAFASLLAVVSLALFVV